VTRQIHPQIQAIVDKTPPLLREFHRGLAMTLSAMDDFDGYAAIMRQPIEEYRREVDAALAELVARDVEDMP